MNFLITAFNVVLANPITNLLVACYQFLNFIHIPFALGFSIIILTFLIRLILYPLTSSQIRTSKKMQDIAPHLSALKEKHKDDKKKHQEEMMKLYQEHGVNPAAGCLPVVLQIPIIWGLYHVLYTVVAVNSIDKLKEFNNLLYFEGLKLHSLWNITFFGIPLSVAPKDEISKMPLLILVPILTGVLQLIYSKMMTPEVAVESKSDDFQATFTKQSMYLFPIMIGFFSFTLPFGLSLYWNAYTIFGILQQYLVAGAGGLHQWKGGVQKIYGKRS